MIMEQRFVWLYRVDTNDNPIGDQPVGKMFLDMIILDFNILMEQDDMLDDPLNSKVNLDSFYWKGNNSEDLMYGFLFNMVSLQDIDISGFFQDRAEILAARNSEGYPGGVVKDVGFCRATTWAGMPDKNVGIFIRIPKSAALDFYFPSDNFPKGSKGDREGVNDQLLLTYFMDPVQVQEVVDGKRGSTKIGIDLGANYMYVKDYNKLLKLWHTKPLFFNSINVEDISR
jgi:hypothetical protein